MTKEENEQKLDGESIESVAITAESCNYVNSIAEKLVKGTSNGKSVVEVATDENGRYEPVRDGGTVRERQLHSLKPGRPTPRYKILEYANSNQ